MLRRSHRRISGLYLSEPRLVQATFHSCREIVKRLEFFMTGREFTLDVAIVPKAKTYSVEIASWLAQCAPYEDGLNISGRVQRVYITLQPPLPEGDGAARHPFG